MEQLPDAIHREIFGFVGERSFFFVALVSKTFRESYKQSFIHHGRHEYNETSYRSRVESISRFQLWIKHHNVVPVEVATPTTVPCSILVKAAANASHEMLGWMIKTGYLTMFDFSLLCGQAARYGNLEALQWARNHGCPWYSSTCLQAAEYGHLHVLQWARENGCPWDGSTCYGAIKNGHLHVLQWATEHGWPWNEGVCSNAAYNGQLHVLAWARENECPCNDDVCINIARSEGHFHIVEWFVELGIDAEEQKTLVS